MADSYVEELFAPVRRVTRPVSVGGVIMGGGQPLVVREGDTISLQNGRDNTVVQIVSVANLSVSVQVGTVGELLIIR